MPNKVIGAREAADLVQDGDVLALHGAGGGNVEPDLLIKTLGERYLETKTPRGPYDLSCIRTGGPQDHRVGLLSSRGTGEAGHRRPLRHGPPDGQACS